MSPVAVARTIACIFAPDLFGAASRICGAIETAIHDSIVVIQLTQSVETLTSLSSDAIRHCIAFIMLLAIIVHPAADFTSIHQCLMEPLE